MLPALACSYLLVHDWDWRYTLHHTTKQDYNSSHHHDKQITPQKMAETSNRKNISRNVRQCSDGKLWKMTQTRTGWHTLHTHCHPYIFLPLTNSRPHPISTACRLPIHSSSTQSTKFHITVSITQQLHHMHKYNNSKSLFSHNCNNQKSLAKTPKQCFSQTTNCIRARLVITHTSRPPYATACSFHTYLQRA